MDTKHTATPWGLDDNHGKRYIEPIGDNAPIAIVCKHKDFQANGEFIIRACNSHEDLIDTLLMASSFIEDCLISKEFEVRDAENTREDIQVTLEKAGALIRPTNITKENQS